MENINAFALEICKIICSYFIYLSMINENPFTACNRFKKYEHALNAKPGL